MCDPFAGGGRGAALGALGGRPHIPVDRNVLMPHLPFFFFSQEGQLPIFLKAKLSAELTFLPSFEHYDYYLTFQNSPVAEVPTLRMQCFSVFIQSAVWIFFPCFYTTNMLCYLHAFESFSFRNLPQFPSAGDFIQSHQYS